MTMVYSIVQSKMLLTKSLKSVVQSLRISKNVPCPYRTNFQRQYCSEKFKIVENESASVFTIRKTLKSAGVESTEGISFIKTLCPVCDFTEGRTDCSIFINKVTGNPTTKVSIRFPTFTFFVFKRKHCMSIVSAS